MTRLRNPKRATYERGPRTVLPSQLVSQIKLLRVRTNTRLADLKKLEPVALLLASPPSTQIRFVCTVMREVATLCRSVMKDNRSRWHALWIHNHPRYPRLPMLLGEHLLRSCESWPDRDVARAIGLAADRVQISPRGNTWLVQLVESAEKRMDNAPSRKVLSGPLRRLANVVGLITNGEERRFTRRVMAMLEPPRPIPFGDGEAWVEEACHALKASKLRAVAWRALIDHCLAAKGLSPSRAWLDAARPLLGKVGEQEFTRRICQWFPLINQPRAKTVPTDYRWDGQAEWYITDESARTLRGLVWCCALVTPPMPPRTLTNLALCAYRKLPGIGPRLMSVGNACIWALSTMHGMEVVHQLKLLKTRLKHPSTQELIDRAIHEAVDRIGLPADDADELVVPTHGLTDVGFRRERMGDVTSELAVKASGQTELSWLRKDGKRQSSVPAHVRREHSHQLKVLQQAAKDIPKSVSAQRDRLESLFLLRKSWLLSVWRERYLDHPLVGTLARRLIWRFTAGDRIGDGVFVDEQIVSKEGAALEWLSTDTTVGLWHPIGQSPEDIRAWRSWLEEHQIQQPFKQAHREVYLLTDAERRTNTYSNRFAAHVLRQHQFNALCAARGWKNKLRLMVDDEYPPATRLLPQWNLRAEFWIEGIGDEYGADINESGVFLRVATDQVRFYPIDAEQRTAHAGGGGYHERYGATQTDTPLVLEQIPPLVFSEIMRDVDLFVGVASVGNDPTWADGGPQGRYRDYWQSYSFGELGESAKARREALERLIPRLKIASRCSLTERFLIVRGDRRKYKIHLGSGNILMEPNDQYLCIVRAPSRDGTNDVFLPFEGDNMLAVILSKAFLLADDRKITDPTITRQIETG